MKITLWKFNHFRTQKINRVIYTRKPDDATFIEEIIWKVNRSILNRLKTFERNQTPIETVQITRTRYDALNLIIKSNEEQLIRIDNDVKIDEIEKTVHQIEDSTLRLEYRLKAMRLENELRKEQINQIKAVTSQLENRMSKFQQESQIKNEQLNRILSELESINRQMSGNKLL